MAAYFKRNSDFLFAGIASHDGVCDILTFVGIKACDKLSYFWFDAHHRHRKANDSG